MKLEDIYKEKMQKWRTIDWETDEGEMSEIDTDKETDTRQIEYL